MEAKLPKLTVKQMRFCEEYIILGNAVQAYFRTFGSVGAKGVKRTYKSVARLTAKLMALRHIQDEIQAIQVASREHTFVTLEELNQADAQAGFLDIAKFMTRVNGQITFSASRRITAGGSPVRQERAVSPPGVEGQGW